MRARVLNSFLLATTALVSSSAVGSAFVENEPLYVHVKYEDGLEFQARRCGDKICQFLVTIKKKKIEISALDGGELDGMILSTISLYYAPHDVSINSFLVKARVSCDVYPIFEHETGPIECFVKFSFTDRKLTETTFYTGTINDKRIGNVRKKQ